MIGTAASGIHENFQAAYLASLNDIKTDYTFDVAPRGQASLEKLGITFKIQNPIQRVCQVPARKTNIVFNFAETLWYLSGSNRIDFITYYAPSLHRYSADGTTLTGTAYGPRLFGKPASQELSQWDRVVRVLKDDDPASKRAVISIFESTEDILLRNIDVSCTLGLQFILRQGCLHMVAFMRANDVYRGMVSDVFSFTLLQELMARQLGAEVGEYHHLVGSLHLYKTDLERASEVLANAERDHGPHHEFPAMPRGDNWPYIRQVLELERAIREGRGELGMRAWKRELPEYWYQVVLLLLLFRTAVKNRKPATDVIDELCPIYRYLVRNRWPDLA
jgi:thymidylate synthase